MIKSTVEEFTGYYGEFLKLIKEMEAPDFQDDYLVKVAEYNLSGGKRFRGALVSAAMEAFTSKGSGSPCQKREAHLVGWCIELVHAGFLVLDDIMDDSPMRRGKPSWFRVQQKAGNGLISINDGLHLVLASKLIIYSIFGAMTNIHKGVHRILQLFDEVTCKTCWGQHLDTTYSQSIHSDNSNGVVNCDTYTRKRFETITQWKTGFYTFYLPIACGMALAGVEKASCYDEVKRITVKFGQYYQAQDDFLDCFADSKTTGKVGTDIVTGKCSWPVVECLSRASDSQRKIIQENYGRQDPKAEEAVLRVYEELNLRNVFREWEREMRRELDHDISSLNYDGTVSDLFKELCETLFCRSF